MNLLKKKMFWEMDSHAMATISAFLFANANKRADLDNTVTALKEHKLKGMRYELMPMSAALGFIEAAPDEKASDIKEIFEYLKTKKGFKWYIGGRQRTLYAGLAYALENLEGDKAVLNSVISTTLTNIIS